MTNKPKIIKCRNCGMSLVAHTKVCPYCSHKTGQRAVREKKKLQVQFFKWKITVPVITLILFILNVACGIVKLLNGDINTLSQYAMVSGALQRGEWIRLITGNFLHVNLYHLAANMYALIVYGFLLENHIGRIRYLIIYIFSMLGASLVINFLGGQYAWHIGASGAIFGLMAADLVYCLKTHRKFLHTLYVLHAVIGNVIVTIFTPGISWQGHFGGAIAGALVALLLIRKDKSSVRKR